MSSQRGNISRSRPQKHKNATGFSNTKHDSSNRTKQILQVRPSGLCSRCKEKIEWKIKYKKYKPLSQPATCTKCHQKTVKKAYHTVCQICAERDCICAKCAEKTNIIEPFEPDKQMQAAHQSQLEEELKLLTERQRRSFFRLQEQGKLKDCQGGSDKHQKEGTLKRTDIDHESSCDSSDIDSSAGQDEEAERDDNGDGKHVEQDLHNEEHGTNIVDDDNADKSKDTQG